eukprot:6199621-Karenia_brevis.AAC.1
MALVQSFLEQAGLLQYHEQIAAAVCDEFDVFLHGTEADFREVGLPVGQVQIAHGFEKAQS